MPARPARLTGPAVERRQAVQAAGEPEGHPPQSPGFPSGFPHTPILTLRAHPGPRCAGYSHQTHR
jgi:hypothetical protein